VAFDIELSSRRRINGASGGEAFRLGLKSNIDGRDKFRSPDRILAVGVGVSEGG
jgi:hypothetical protein